MVSLGQLLKSPVRIDVLRSLFSVEVPLGLRLLARMSQAHPYATSRVLQDLVEETLVEKTSSLTRPMYRICAKHPHASRLRRIFEADRETGVLQEQEDLSRRAQAFVEFNSKALQMLKQARGSMNGFG
jgi:DNA-binding IclR family transcriptional regulator